MSDFTLGVRIDMNSYITSLKEKRVLQIRDVLLETVQRFGGSLPDAQILREIEDIIRREEKTVLNFPKEAVHARRMFIKIIAKRNKALATLHV